MPLVQILQKKWLKSLLSSLGNKKGISKKEINQSQIDGLQKIWIRQLCSEFCSEKQKGFKSYPINLTSSDKSQSNKTMSRLDKSSCKIEVKRIEFFHFNHYRKMNMVPLLNKQLHKWGYFEWRYQTLNCCYALE